MPVDFNDFFKNSDSKALRDGIKKAEEYLKTAEGKKIAEKIKRGENTGNKEYDALIALFKNNPELIKKLKNPK